MSNVLIGIIGVILFIGLALAGALILGDDFRSATNETQAAAAVAQLQQVKAAADMWKLKTGQSTIMNQDTTFLVPRFLKIRAQNPTRFGTANPTSYPHATRFNNDLCPDATNEGGSIPASHIQIAVGQGATGDAICQAIADQQAGGVIDTAVRPTRAMGCARFDATQCGYSGVWNVAYATL